MAPNIITPIVASVIGAPLALYSAFLALSAVPYFQRHFLYAHKVSTTWWHNLDEPEYWGFAKNQVAAFSLKTADDQTIYAWHVLPLPIYAHHEEILAAQSTGFSADVTNTENFRILKEDPDARLIICFHGNAGHVAQGWRPASYHSLTDTSRYHVLAIDYRGFGRSTGSPTENGLIVDASAAVHWAIQVAGVPASRIVLFGHSLGTAVASAAAACAAKEGVDFAGVILISGFSTLPEMLSGYAIAGWVPVLAPMRISPWLLKTFMSFVVDKWASADRWRETVRTVKARSGRLRLFLVHAKNDWDIPCHEDDKLFAAAVEGTMPEGSDAMGPERLAAEKKTRTVVRGKDAFVSTWNDGDVVIRQELFRHGGHNTIMYFAPVLLAVNRAFDKEYEVVR